MFDMLIMSDDKSLQTLLRMVDTDLLVLALKGAMNRFKKNCLGVCQRGQRLISWMRWKRSTSASTEVQGAQKEIINVARRSDEGTIVLAGRGGDDLV